MHIYIAIRGLISAVKKWENFMTSQYLPFEILEKGKKKPTKYLAQLQVREIKMYEIVCPKESEDVVMGMIKPDLIGKGFAGMWGKSIRMFSKLLGLKKCSTTWKPNIIPSNEGMAIIVLGTKDDKMNWTKKEDKNVFALGHIPKEML